MYSAEDGHMTDFHLVHLGSVASRGISLTITEVTSVLANGRITPEDTGLWKDSQIAPLKRVADFLHSQNQKLGIQLGHAGRKASTCAAWLKKEGGPVITATEDVGGWPDDVMGPSAICWGEGFPSHPREMSKQDIQDVINAFRDSAKRAVAAGVDVIEIHAAHGYLLCSFLSPLSNQRTDDYGGSFDNRTRLLREVIKVVREVIPSGMPLLLRVSSTEWMEAEATESWDIPSTIRLAKLLPALGVDLLDVSSGGNNVKQKVDPYNDFQVSIASEIRHALHHDGITDLLIGAVGMITQAEVAKEIVQIAEQKGADELIEVEDEQGKIAQADVVLIGRQMLREPEWVLRVAHKLGVKVKWPQQ